VLLVGDALVGGAGAAVRLHHPRGAPPCAAGVGAAGGEGVVAELEASSSVLALAALVRLSPPPSQPWFRVEP
jgi:hypothetical protein